MPFIPLTNPCRSRGRRTAFGLLTASAVAAAVVIPTGAAFAAPASSPSSPAGAIASLPDLDAYLRSAPAGSQTQLKLAGNFDGEPDSASDLTVQTLPNSDVVLDLNGNTVHLAQLEVSDGASLEVEDSTSAAAGSTRGDLAVGSELGSAGVLIDGGATLHVDGTTLDATGSTGLAGIGSPASVTSGAGTFIATGGAYITAQGGAGGAGIGGAQGAAAVSVSETDSSIDATGGADGAGIGSGSGGVSSGSLTTATTPSTGTGTDPWYVEADWEFRLQARGGAGAAGIGGGLQAPGAVVHLGAGTAATVRSGVADSAAPQAPAANTIGNGQGADAFGSLAVDAGASLTIPLGSDLDIPSGASAVNAGQITVQGVLSGSGVLANKGTLNVGSGPLGGLVTIAGVSGNDYLVTLDANGGSWPSSTPAPTPLHVWAHVWYPEVAAPTPPSKDLQFVGWNTKADGTGEDFTSGSFFRSSIPSLQHLTGKLSTDGAPVPVTAYAVFTPRPHFTGSTVPSAGVGVPYDQPLPIAGDVTHGALVIDTEDQHGNEIPDLPPGLSLDPVTHHITGIPTQTGTFTFLVEADDLDENQVFQQVTIKIAGAPAVGTVTLPAAKQGGAFSTQLAASGDGAITWDLASGALPAGLTLSPSGLLSGTPTGSGTSTFTVRATSEYGVSTKQLTVAVAAAPTPAPAPVAEPVLPVLPVAHVLFGHRLDLSAAASSTVPVTYTATGNLPKGVALDRETGLLSGVVGESGTFHVVITATSSAGSARVPATIEVPKVQQLLTGATAPAALTHAGTTKLSVRGFLKGEHYRVTVDGKVVQQGVMAKAGTLRFSVHLSAAKGDRVHQVSVTGLRRLTDPSKRASATFGITVVADAKRLEATAGRTAAGVRVHVQKLAAGEQVTVREGRKVVARGTADASGSFTFTSAKLARGTHHLVITGATADRTASITV